jgi:EAL domain-containing protein (putative c-di-GMP-specific phosphodiesterase class I)
VFRRILRTNTASVRQQLQVRVAMALGAVAVSVSLAGVLAARQEAGQRVDGTARTARAVFNQSLAVRTRGAAGTQARRRAAAMAAHDAGRATGAEVTLGAPASAGRTFSYPVRGGGRLSIVVSTTPVANATRSALLMGLGIGAGVVLVLMSLLVAGIDRVVAAPLGRFADAIRRVAGGDATARADEDGPREVREAAAGFNSLLAKVTEQRERLAAAAASDPLTGVTNNQQFHESLGIELKRAQRDQAAVSLVVIDIDGFGSINDAHGRGFGDEVLQRVAAYPDDARDGATLLQLAGGALRWAKSSGRGQTRRYDPEQVSVPTDQEERAEIEGLLEREQPVIPFFQPLVSLSTGRILGFEALSRFPDPPGRGPDAWFAQAARCGLGARLEAAALRAALAKPGRPAGTFLSINVSPSTISSAEVHAVLPADMTGLVVEITEHELADDLDGLERELTSLRERGAKIAVDDAGAGYSGLQQVMRIQPDVIKLDRSLVMNLHEDPAKEALIDSFVRFARRTGASVCAEGIETIDELKLLADLDVTYGQGYVLARPAPEWGTVAKSVSESLLRSSLRSQGDLSSKDALPESGDQRLEYVSARLSRIHAVEDLEDVFELIAAEVGADAVCLSRWVRAENAVESVVDSTGDDPGARFNLANYPSTAHVLNTGEAVQVLISDPGADLGELALLGRLGYESLLMVPVVCRDERLGLLEAYGLNERPWTRSEINRARIISYQLGAVLDGLERVQAANAAPGSQLPVPSLFSS